MKLSIAEFKRRMTVGTKWNFNSNWCDHAVRTCTIANTVSFALTGVQNPAESSFCSWPLKAEVAITDEGGKMQAYIVHEFGWLIYKEA